MINFALCFECMTYFFLNSTNTVHFWELPIHILIVSAMSVLTAVLHSAIKTTNCRTGFWHNISFGKEWNERSEQKKEAHILFSYSAEYSNICINIWHMVDRPNIGFIDINEV